MQIHCEIRILTNVKNTLIDCCLNVPEDLGQQEGIRNPQILQMHSVCLIPFLKALRANKRTRTILRTRFFLAKNDDKLIIEINVYEV